MPTEQLLIYGAGGHAAVVVDTLFALKTQSILTVVDNNPDLEGTRLLGLAIQSASALDGMPFNAFHVAIGSGTSRKAIYAQLSESECSAASIIHPDATVSAFAELQPGCFVAARAVLGPRSKMGSAVIVNHGAVVDHDCVIGNFSHIAPTASLGGQVVVGECVLIGAGANILPGIIIGDGAAIGAGAVVTKDVPAGAVVTGIPAGLRKNN